MCDNAVPPSCTASETFFWLYVEIFMYSKENNSSPVWFHIECPASSLICALEAYTVMIAYLVSSDIKVGQMEGSLIRSKHLGHLKTHWIDVTGV